jgi:hypothetical protein
VSLTQAKQLCHIDKLADDRKSSAPKASVSPSLVPAFLAEQQRGCERAGVVGASATRGPGWASSPKPLVRSAIVTKRKHWPGTCQAGERPLESRCISSGYASRRGEVGAIDLPNDGLFMSVAGLDATTRRPVA